MPNLRTEIAPRVAGIAASIKYDSDKSFSQSKWYSSPAVATSAVAAKTIVNSNITVSNQIAKWVLG